MVQVFGWEATIWYVVGCTVLLVIGWAIYFRRHP